MLVAGSEVPNLLEVDAAVLRWSSGARKFLRQLPAIAADNSHMLKSQAPGYLHWSLPPAEETQAVPSDDPEVNEPNPFDTLGFGIPADQGLAGLGMLMQFGGGVMAIVASIVAVSAMSEVLLDEASSGWLVLIAALSSARSVMHRRAGTGLVNCPANLLMTPLVLVRHYITFAWLHSFLVAAILQAGLHVQTSAAIGAGLGLAVWPGVLAVTFSLPRFRRFRTEVPIADDRGFEGLAIYNTLFGVCALGALAVAVLVVRDEAIHEYRRGLVGIALLPIAALAIRALAQVYAGLRGLGTTSLEDSIKANRRYFGFAVVGAGCFAFVMLVIQMVAPSPSELLTTFMSCCTLLVWPLAIRRFVAERQYFEFTNAGGAADFQRSPDAGLTWLGWLLICIASVSTSCFVAQLFADGNLGYGNAAHPGFVPAMLHLLSWAVPLAVLPAWAGCELVRMSNRARAVTAAFCIAAAGHSLWITRAYGPELLRDYPFGSDCALALTTIGLALPVATWLLVRRKLPSTPPLAIARFRSA